MDNFEVLQLRPLKLEQMFAYRFVTKPPSLNWGPLFTGSQEVNTLYLLNILFYLNLHFLLTQEFFSVFLDLLRPLSTQPDHDREFHERPKRQSRYRTKAINETCGIAVKKKISSTSRTVKKKKLSPASKVSEQLPSQIQTITFFYLYFRRIAFAVVLVRKLIQQPTLSATVVAHLVQNGNLLFTRSGNVKSGWHLRHASLSLRCYVT